jgi:outer membrane protein assembly factor BamB
LSRKVLGVVGALALLGGMAVAGFLLVRPHEDPGHLESRPGGVAYQGPEKRRPVRARYHLKSRAEQPCWLEFGGNGERTSALPTVNLGPPARHLWARALDGYIEYPPVYCDGLLYVNTFRGSTYAVDSETGKIVWRRRGAHKPSSPAIAGATLLVAANDGTVTAYDRFDGHRLWRVATGARVESSPATARGSVYVGSADGRVFALAVRTGHVRWAFATGGTINSSPTLVGDRVCVTTYAGSIFCLRARDGRKLWSTYLKRDPLRYESFYASMSTDGRRLYTIARSGRILALRVSDGSVVWSQRVEGWGYSSPAVAYGRLFVGGFDGRLHAYDARSGHERWTSHVGGRILGAPVVIGQLVFFATLERRTYAARVSDGGIVWRIRIGKYSPTIATRRHYYMSLNGLLAAFRGRRSPLECNPNESHALSLAERRACRRRARSKTTD